MHEGISVSRTYRFLGSVAAVTAGFAFALAPMGAAPARAATEHVVDIRDMAFGPGTLTIAVGDTVTWTNSDGMPHTATSEDDAFDSGNLDEGQSFSFTFTEPGTYEYRCDYHSDMTGTIVVEASGQGGPAASAEPSAGANPDTALPGTDGGMQLPTLLMGLGLVVVAVSVFRFAPVAVACTPRQGGGWNR
jgi:plastocyanin